MTVTRRKMAVLLAAAATQVTAQAPPPAPPKPTADQDLADARLNLRGAALQLARVPLPMSTEPAFRFRA